MMNRVMRAGVVAEVFALSSALLRAFCADLKTKLHPSYSSRSSSATPSRQGSTDIREENETNVHLVGVPATKDDVGNAMQDQDNQDVKEDQSTADSAKAGAPKSSLESNSYGASRESSNSKPPFTVEKNNADGQPATSVTGEQVIENEKVEDVESFLSLMESAIRKD